MTGSAIATAQAISSTIGQYQVQLTSRRRARPRSTQSRPGATPSTGRTRSIRRSRASRPSSWTARSWPLRPFRPQASTGNHCRGDPTRRPRELMSRLPLADAPAAGDTCMRGGGVYPSALSPRCPGGRSLPARHLAQGHVHRGIQPLARRRLRLLDGSGPRRGEQAGWIDRRSPQGDGTETDRSGEAHVVEWRCSPATT